MDTIAFEKELNPEQNAAATAPDGPLLVLAAAGTGKTRTLVYRVAYLMRKGIDPARILLLTFTNKAAREMLDRARALVGVDVGGLWGGTFHHMANRMLRRHAHHLGFKLDYIILDSDDSTRLIKQAVKDCRLATKEFPKAEVLADIFGMAANTGQPVSQVAAKRFAEHPVDLQDISMVHEAYSAKKRATNAMDFDDLLVYGLELFRQQPGVLDHYKEKFLYTLVDEYQDTNPIQSEWIDKIASQHRNLLVVGDDFQSIYSWRGADFRNIMSFPDRYPDAKTYLLETNYRSIPEILNVANACIAGNPAQFQKVLRSTRPSSAKPLVAHLRDGEHQSAFVTDHINRLLQEGYKPSEIAVLYRAHFHAMELQLNLTRTRIPYVITSGVRFFEQAHVKDVCSLLRILHTPGDELAFKRFLQLMPKVGEKTAHKIWIKLGRTFAATDPAQRKLLRTLLPSLAAAVWKDIEPICKALVDEHLEDDPGEVIQRFIQTYYERYALNSFDNFERRLEDLQELVLFTAKFESLTQMLNEIALLTNLDTEAAATGASPEKAVRLSTVHQAKGLEWRAVILIWITEGMFPSSRAMAESPEAEAEERRLFYVAVTRAKDNLVICVPSWRRMRDQGIMPVSPSRFVTEIPPRLYLDRNIR